MARLAAILHDGSPGWREQRLSRILDFFGVPSKVVSPSELLEIDRRGLSYAVIGSIRGIAAILGQGQGANSLTLAAHAYYAYLDEERDLSNSALQSLLGDTNVSLQPAPPGDLTLQVSSEPADLAGPMAGLKFSLRLGSEDAVLACAPADGRPTFVTVISAANRPVFLQFHHNAAHIFLCTCSRRLPGRRRNWELA